MCQAANDTCGEDEAERPDLVPWENGRDLVSLQTFQRFYFAAQCVVKPLVVAVGVPANAVNCLVFYRQGLRDRMNLCLFCLAASDLLYLLFLFLQTVPGPYAELLDESLGKEIYFKSIRYGNWFSDEMRTMSSLITMVIAVERCVCVTFPLHASSLVSTRTVACLLAAMYVVTQTCCVTHLLQYDVVSYLGNSSSNDTSQTGVFWKIVVTKFWHDNYAVLNTLYNAVLMTALPVTVFVVMSLTTAVTVFKLRAAVRWRKLIRSNSSESQSRHLALTKMLVLVSCIYITAMLPFVTLVAMTLFSGEFNLGKRFQNFFLTVGILATLSSMVNSSVHVFVYYHQSSRYRNTLMFVCRKTKELQDPIQKEDFSKNFRIRVNKQ